MNEINSFSEELIKIEDITHAFLNSPDQESLIVSDEKRVIRPRYQDTILSLFSLMEFPLFGSTVNSKLSLYGAILSHGKANLIELFFIDEENERYIGTFKVFKVEFPENSYSKDYDEWLMDELSSQAFGISQEYKKVAENIPFIESML